MLLAIDIGNTRIKSAIFDHNNMIEHFWFEHAEFKSGLQHILKKYPQCKDTIVANVGRFEPEEFRKINPMMRWHFLTHQSVFPFQNHYATPKTLGIDRMVLSAGAVLQFPNTNRLVIDAGTCITYDFINNKDQYLGGAISPGIRLRYEVLHQHTAKLPLLSPLPPESFIGNSTAESIHSGVIFGVLHEIDGFIEQYKATNENITIILTGGDSEFLAKRLKNTIFAPPSFLLESMNQIFQYQSTND